MSWLDYANQQIRNFLVTGTPRTGDHLKATSTVAGTFSSEVDASHVYLMDSSRTRRALVSVDDDGIVHIADIGGDLRATISATGGTLYGNINVTNQFNADGGITSGDVVAGTYFSLGSGLIWIKNAGTPEGAYGATVGSVASNTSGDILSACFGKTSGSSGTGWSRFVFAGERAAIDANHLHVYKCQDDAGSATMHDDGATPKTLTLSGTEGTAYTKRSRRGLRGSCGVRLYADTSARGASSAATASIPSGPLTIEAIAIVEPGVDAFIVGIDAGANDYFFILATSAGNVIAGCKIASTEHNTAGTTVILARGVVNHLMATYDKTANPTLKFYLNGKLVATDNAQTATAPTWTRVSVGQVQSVGNFALYGNIIEARVSNIVRGAAYAVTNSEIAFAL